MKPTYMFIFNWEFYKLAFSLRLFSIIPLLRSTRYCLQAHTEFCGQDHEENTSLNEIFENKEDVLRGKSKSSEYFKKAAVCSELPEASEVGKKILKRGGNAVDAMVATCFCIGIFNSFSSGIGGGGFAMISKPNTDGSYKVKMFDFRETAPEKISDVDINPVKINAISKGLAVCVPGEVAGLYKLHEIYGLLAWEDLFEEIIPHAKKFKVSEQLERRLKKFKTFILNDPEFSNVYTKNGELVRANDFICRENYAKTLSTISKNPMDFYLGGIAKEIIETVSKNGGVMSLEDLKKYKVKPRNFLEGTFMGYKIYTTNVPSSGCFLILGLNILESLIKKGIFKIHKKYTKDTLSKNFHLLVEIFRFMYANRSTVGDYDNLTEEMREEIINKVSVFISKDYAASSAAKIKVEETLPAESYGKGGIFQEDCGTTHINIVDENGMIVMVTSTINSEFGAKIMCPRTGIVFNNQLDDFNIPGHPNSYGLINMHENPISPNSRPFSSAAPIIIRNEREILCLGAAGGTRIPTTIMCIVFYMLLGANLEEAIDYLRIHNQFCDDKTTIEINMPDFIVKYLTNAGHEVKTSELNTIFTSAQGLHILNDPNTREVHIFAASDKRKGGSSMGY